MWELEFWRDVIGFGVGTAVLLFAAHYGLNHWRAAFLAHPPRAYSLGGIILAAGCFSWAALHATPAPPLQTAAALFVLCSVAGSGTWGAYALHAYQQRRAQAASRAA